MPFLNHLVGMLQLESLRYETDGQLRHRCADGADRWLGADEGAETAFSVLDAKALSPSSRVVKAGKA